MTKKAEKANKIGLLKKSGEVVIVDETVCRNSAAKRRAAKLKDIGAKLRVRRHDAMRAGNRHPYRDAQPLRRQPPTSRLLAAAQTAIRTAVAGPSPVSRSRLQ
jgi:hypothetical protein